MNLVILIACGVISISALVMSAAAVRKEHRSSANQSRKRDWQPATSEQVEPEKKTASAASRT